MNPLNRINSLYYPKDSCPLPKVVMLEPADSCTLKCIMCDVQQQKKGPPHFITLPQFEVIIGQFPVIKELIFCGIGEPLLNKDIYSMIKSASAKKIPFINLVTNGELLNKEVFRRLDNSGLHQLQVSVPAVTESAFMKIRNNPQVSLGQVSRNLQAISRMKKEISSSVKIIINMVMNSHNYPELKEAVGFCKKAGADGICFIQLTTIFGKNEHMNINKKGISRIFSEIKESGRKEGLEIIFLTGNDYGRCYQLWDYIMIHADGRVSPCNGIMPTENINVGNIWENKIKDIWLSDAYRALRRKVRTSSLENCRFCESGYLIEGITPGWLKNFYIRPIRNFVAQKTRAAIKGVLGNKERMREI